MAIGNHVLGQLPTTIFTTMSALAVEVGAINLGQGFPDDDGPEALRRLAADAVLKGPSQYPPMMGIMPLRQAVADHAKRFYGLELDASAQVLVTSGATEALTASLFALLNPGDEVILFEPAYDSYAPMARLIGAKPVFVRLDAPDWRLTPAKLAAALSPRTRAILVNSPMNPIGKVFDETELALIAHAAQAHDLLVIGDEVYEHITFDGVRHRPLMTWPGMAERCVRIGSAGKTFSLTGWKIGYLSGPAHLVGVIAKAHQFLTFTTPPALQSAIAQGLGFDDIYFDNLASDLQAKRDRLSEGLKAAGFDVLKAEGTYFLVVDLSAKGVSDDVAFAMDLTRRAKVASIPLSAFYEQNPPRHLIRFCFSKRFEVLDEAARRLAQAFAQEVAA